MSVKEELHREIEKLTDEEAREWLQRFRNPLRWSLEHAPYDDELLSEEDNIALQEAWEDVKHGRINSHEEAKRILLGEDS